MNKWILYRYILRGYATPFGACLGLFSILVLFGRYFDKMGSFNHYNAGLGNIVMYLLLGLPYWINLVLPVATLLALLFALGTLQQRGELTAMRSAGIASGKLYAPYFAVALLLAALSLAGGIWVFPHWNFESRTIYRVAIKNVEAVSYRRDNVVAAGQDNRQFTIGWVDVEKNRLEQIVLDQFDKDLVWLESVSASEAEYVEGRWRFKNGLHRWLDASGVMREEKFSDHWMTLKEKPRDFIVEDKNPDDMTAHELRRRIKRLKQLGTKTASEQTAYHLRMALPFANVVVVALGIPFAVRQGRKGRLQTFAYALLASFVYWGCVSVFQSFGEQGTLPATLAAWLPNILFAGVSVGLFRKAVV